MRLDFVEICGFRGFRDVARITFGRGFTVITGRNGVGKSTVGRVVLHITLPLAESGTSRNHRHDAKGRMAKQAVPHPWSFKQGLPRISLEVVVEPGSIERHWMSCEYRFSVERLNPLNKVLKDIGRRLGIVCCSSPRIWIQLPESHGAGICLASSSGARTASNSPNGIPASETVTDPKASIEFVPGTGPSNSQSVTT